MNEFIVAVQHVWSVAALATAILGGLVVGVLIAGISRLKPDDNPRSIAIVVVLAASLYAGVFWAGQITESITSGDTSWPRALARAVLQIVYGGFTALGFYFVAAAARRRKR